MAAHVVLLFLLFCQGERSGISEATGLLEEDEDLQAISSKKQQALPHLESMDILFVRISGLEIHIEDAEGDVRAVPDVDFQQNDRKPDDFGFENNPTKLTASSFIPPSSTELSTSKRRKEKGEVEGVINDHSLVPRSKEVYTVQPEIYMDNAVGDIQPESTQDGSKWRPESEPHLPQVDLHLRRRRSWLWNQFFVIEEYRGPEPVLIGRVSSCHKKSACTSLVTHIMFHNISEDRKRNFFFHQHNFTLSLWVALLCLLSSFFTPLFLRFSCHTETTLELKIHSGHVERLSSPVF